MAVLDALYKVSSDSCLVVPFLKVVLRVGVFITKYLVTTGIRYELVPGTNWYLVTTGIRYQQCQEQKNWKVKYQVTGVTCQMVTSLAGLGCV